MWTGAVRGRFLCKQINTGSNNMFCYSPWHQLNHSLFPLQLFISLDSFLSKPRAWEPEKERKRERLLKYHHPETLHHNLPQVFQCIQTQSAWTCNLKTTRRTWMQSADANLILTDVCAQPLLCCFCFEMETRARRGGVQGKRKKKKKKETGFGHSDAFCSVYFWAASRVCVNVCVQLLFLNACRVDGCFSLSLFLNKSHRLLKCTLGNFVHARVCVCIMFSIVPEVESVHVCSSIRPPPSFPSMQNKNKYIKRQPILSHARTNAQILSPGINKRTVVITQMKPAGEQRASCGSWFLISSSHTHKKKILVH